MKDLLAQEEIMIPALFSSLKKALTPLLDDSTYVAMRAVMASAEARGRSGMKKSSSNKRDKERNCEGLETKASPINNGNVEASREREPKSLNVTESSSCRPNCTIA